MEITLKKSEYMWTLVEFAFVPHKGNPVVQVMEITDEEFEVLAEHQVFVQNLFVLRSLAAFCDPGAFLAEEPVQLCGCLAVAV